MRLPAAILAIVLTTLGSAAWLGRPSMAATDGPFTLSAKGHGVQLSARIPHRDYAPNAIIAVKVTIKNTNRHLIRLPGFPQHCNSYNPAPIVSDDSGKVVYPPPVPTLVPPPCGEGAVTLEPKQAVTITQYAIARAPNLRVSFQFDVPDRLHNLVRITLLTPSIRLRFVSRPAATVTLHTSQSGIYAVVHRPKGARGPLLYAADDNCPLGAPSIPISLLAWALARTSRLTASCPFPPHWVAVAGWVNYPVAQIDYRSP